MFDKLLGKKPAQANGADDVNTGDVILSAKAYKNILEIINKIAKGDLSVDVDKSLISSSTQAETAIITSVAKMKENLCEMIKEFGDHSYSLDVSGKNLNDTSRKLLHNTGEVSVKSDAVTASAVEMSSNMNSISAAAEEMSANMRTISDNARQSSENVNAVASATEEMSSTVMEITRNAEEAKVVVGNAVSNVNMANEKVRKLEEAAKEINNVITSITDISDQTKLLALNATIEAARAGEAGKGFAVVANEVKNLALQTNVATTEIRSRISAMQNATKTTIEDINKIKAIIENVNNIVTTITQSVKEQSTATKEIASNISTAAAGISEMTNAVQQGFDAVQEVNVNINNAAQKATDVADAMKIIEAAALQLKSDSTVLYAGAMEVSSIGADVMKRVDMVTLPENMRTKVARQELFKFTPAYSVYVDDMDSQHRGIIDRINKIYNCIKTKRPVHEVREILRDLADYTTKHFANEEKLMLAKHYPEYESHKPLHTKLLSSVGDIVAKMDRDEEVNLIDVMVFLKDWLQMHILKIDKKYGSYYREHGLI